MKKYFLYIVTALFLASCGAATNKKEETHSHEDGKEHSHAKGEDHKHKGEHAHKDGTTHTHSKVNTDCHNCGMPSNEFPKWRVKVEAEAKGVWYCSPRCMFMVTLDQAKAPKGIKSIQVVEYYNTKGIDGKTAYYVTGSDILGPMGHDFVPLKDKAAADDFKKEHKGDKVLKFDEISLETVKEIVGKK